VGAASAVALLRQCDGLLQIQEVLVQGSAQLPGLPLSEDDARGCLDGYCPRQWLGYVEYHGATSELFVERRID